MVYKSPKMVQANWAQDSRSPGPTVKGPIILEPAQYSDDKYPNVPSLLIKYAHNHRCKQNDSVDDAEDEEERPDCSTDLDISQVAEVCKLLNNQQSGYTHNRINCCFPF